MPGEYRFLDGWYMWNRIKREDFGWAVVFSVVYGSASKLLCIFLYHLSLVQTFLLLAFPKSTLSSELLFLFLLTFFVRWQLWRFRCSLTAHSARSRLAFLLIHNHTVITLISLRIITMAIAIIFNHLPCFHRLNLPFFQNTWQARAVISLALHTDCGCSHTKEKQDGEMHFQISKYHSWAKQQLNSRLCENCRFYTSRQTLLTTRHSTRAAPVEPVFKSATWLEVKWFASGYRVMRICLLLHSVWTMGEKWIGYALLPVVSSLFIYNKTLAAVLAGGWRGNCKTDISS